MEDITLRALRVLKEADVIACEDTRRTAKLLRFHGISTPLCSCHEHNERRRTIQLVERLHRDELVALVSDAGMPVLSDPGGYLLQAARDEGIPVDVLPGPDAVIPALVLSGFPTAPFLFFGFPPEKSGQFRRALQGIAEVPGTVVFYLSPHKAERHLADIRRVLGDRRAAVVREISKIHQAVHRGPLSELEETAAGGRLKGELVLVVDGCGESRQSKGDWRALAAALHDRGLSDRDIAAVVAEQCGAARNSVKDFLLGQSE